MKRVFSIAVVLVFLVLIAGGQSRPLLKFDYGTLVLSGSGFKNSESTTVITTDDEWKEILRVYTQEAFTRKINQPIAGHYFWNGDSIVFTPSFPFASGETYHAVFSGSAFLSYSRSENQFLSDIKLELSFSIPKEKSALSSIDAVYPQSALLPENTLRMYIYFSSPMMPGEAYDHIKLLRSNGTKVEKAFLVVDQELWDAERKRFTLLFDPGRIKRSLKSNLDLGMALHEDETYHLVIDSTWRDANGNFLRGSVKKSFTVTKPERTKLSTKKWKVIAPLAGSRGDVVVSFDRPLDHALNLKYMVIKNSSSDIVDGNMQTHDDLTWSFTPDRPWINGDYEITMSPLLEDICGNNFNNVFDIDLTMESRINSTEPVNFRFSISAVNKQ